MTPVERDVVHVAMAYAVFLHERLALCAPSITVVRLDGASSDPASSSLMVTRRDLAGGSFQLEARVVAEPIRADREISAMALSSGEPVGSVTFVVPGPGGEPTTDRQLARYVGAAAAGLVTDLPQGVWPADLPADFEVVMDHAIQPGTHVERVGGYTRIIVRALRGPLALDDSFAEAVVGYAPLHDIGQVVMGDEILGKPGRLGPTEWREMQTHTTRGRRIVDEAIDTAPDLWPLPDVLRNIVECHHEALDGSGYPRGLEGDAVPLEARIVSVADVFDALTSARPYKPGWSADEALEEMDRMVSAGKIDPLCLTALVTLPDLVEAVAASGSVDDDPIGHDY